MNASNSPLLALPKPEPRKRTRARLDRLQAKADTVIYAAVDARDGMRSRLSNEYCGYEIQRHHMIPRSRGGETTTANVVSLSANEHLVGVHGGYLRLSGNADTRNAHGALSGVKVERLVNGVWTPAGYR